MKKKFSSKPLFFMVFIFLLYWNMFEYFIQKVKSIDVFSRNVSLFVIYNRV